MYEKSENVCMSMYVCMYVCMSVCVYDIPHLVPPPHLPTSHITHHTGVFSILSDGTLRTVSDLDYEAVTRYDLVVEVQDGGVPPMIDSTTVVIMVTDINDNAPSFINLPTAVQIREVCRRYT